MAKRKNDKYQGHFNEAAEPKSKGGRRSRHPVHPASLAALDAGRKKWQPGCASPNPTGRPRAHKESVDFLRGHDDEINAYIVAIARKGAEGKLTNSDKIWSQHLWAMKEYMFGRNPQSVMVTSLDAGASSVDGSGVSALLMRARYEQTKKSVAIEAKPGVFIADASGNVAAPAPEPAPADLVYSEKSDIHEVPTQSTPTSVCRDVAPTEPEAAAAPAREIPSREPPPKPKVKKASHPAASQFPGFQEFLNEKASREQFNDLAKRQEEARRQGRPGGQIPMSELQPDPQPGQEFVRLTLAGNGQIKRC